MGLLLFTNLIPLSTIVIYPILLLFERGKRLTSTGTGSWVMIFSVRDSNTFRIVVIGSSNISGPNHLLEYHNFPELMEKTFRENNIRVEVLNCGVDGAGRSLQLLQSIPYKILEFELDLILFECELPLYNSNISREAYRGVNIFILMIIWNPKRM